MMFSLKLMTCVCDQVVILQGETRCLSLLGLKGVRRYVDVDYALKLGLEGVGLPIQTVGLFGSQSVQVSAGLQRGVFPYCISKTFPQYNLSNS